MDQVNHKEFDDLNLQFVVDDFEIDGLDFKPVTDGLGFHGEKEKVTPSFLSDQKIRRRDYSPLSKEVTLQHSPQTINLDSMSKGLESFYGPKVAPTKRKANAEAKASKKDMVAAKLSHQLGAYGIDLLVITLSLGLTAVLFSWLAFADLSVPLFKYFLKTNYDFLTLLGSLYYLAYFTLLDIVGSVGKKAFSLIVISSKTKESPTVIQMFNRSILCLFGSLLFFMPCILDLHGRLSQTVVIRKQ